MTDKLKLFANNLINNKTAMLVLLLTIAIIISIFNYHNGIKYFWGGEYTFYNNYLIFKYSFFHLIENKNLYTFYPEYGDLFKYSPSFALFMGIFAYLPDLMGLICWNCLNVVIFCLGFYSLKQFSYKNLNYIFLFILFELIVSIQGAQSNLILAGLIILTYSYLEKDKPGIATLFIVLGTFIKLFSVVTCLFLLMYPKKIKSASYLFLWFILIGALPLFIVSPGELISQYLNWGQLLFQDHSNSFGLSVYQYVAPLIPFQSNKLIILTLGILILGGPLLLYRQYSTQNFRITYLCFTLVWIVIFNHKAESPTYIIAMTGYAIWWLNSRKSILGNIIFAMTFLLTSLRLTDLIPNHSNYIFLNWIYIKPIMSIFVFFLIFRSFFKMKISEIEWKR